MEASELLPVQGVHPCRRATRDMPGAWREDRACPVGETGQWVHAPVRGVGGRDGPPPAGQHARRAGRRDRHPPVAVHRPLRGRGPRSRGLHGRGGHRHRRDQPQGAPLHHGGRRPRRARRDQRDGRQGLVHGEAVRRRLHGAQWSARIRAARHLRHEPGVPEKASADTCPTRSGSSTSSTLSSTPTRPSTRSGRPWDAPTGC